MAPFDNFQDFISANSNPSTATTPNPGPTAANQYLTQMQQMLQPYQAMAQKAYPQNPVFGNDRFAQNHPQLAGALGNAFLTASMIRPGQTVGDSIANVAGGVIGANQWHQKQALNAQMLPYQMVQPQVALQKNLSDIAEANARTGYYGSEGAWRASEIAKASFPHGISSPKVDDQGHPWQEVFDPTTGSVSSKPVGWAPPQGYAPTFKNDERNQHMNTPGGLQGEIMGNLLATDPALQALGKKQLGVWTQMQGASAGARTAADQSAPHPQQNMQTFVETQRQNLFNDIKAPPKDIEAYVADQVMSGQDVSDPKKTGADYQGAINTYNGALDQRKKDFAQYEASTAPAKGVDFATWRSGQRAPASAPQSNNAPKGSLPVGW